MKMANLGRYRGFLILTLLYGSAFGAYTLYRNRTQPEPVVIVTPSPVITATPAPIQVHVAGAVRRPGVYELPPNSRLMQAVEAAGGFSEDADAEVINLADYLRDAQQVYVPHVGTPAPPSPTTAVQGNAGASGGSSRGGLVNINTATQAELERLPGIGPTYAERIIAYRQANGPFRDTAQLKQVSGIGDSLYQRIQRQITVR